MSKFHTVGIVAVELRSANPHWLGCKMQPTFCPQSQARCCGRSTARNADPAALAAWQAAVHGLRVAVNSWLAKASKHAMVAYPLLTQLLCLEADDGFQQGIGPLLDTLVKQLRVRLSALVTEHQP